MIESPVLDAAFELVTARATRKNILRVLERRFGAVPDAVRAGLQAVADEGELDALVDAAAVCPSMATFEDELRKQF